MGSWAAGWGGDRGTHSWPSCYYDGREDRKVLGPAYGGDGTGGAFVAFHGGFNRPDPFRDEGFNVVFMPFVRGAPSGRDEVFADGFIGEGAVSLPGDADDRPVGLAEGPDGSLYITGDRGGRIWRVLHASRK